MELNWISPITPQTSYGYCGINFVTALTELGHEVSLFPIGRPEIDKGCPWTQKPIQEALNRGQYNYSRNAHCIRLYHQFSQSEFVGKGKHYAFPIFELNKFTNLEIAQLSRVDAIISPSTWSDSVIKSEIIDREYEKAVHSNFKGGNEITNHIVPLGYDQRVFETQMRSVYNDKSTTKFLTIGKTEVRKSSREIVETFKKTFKPDDNVELWLSWQNLFNSENEQREWDNFAKSGPMGEKIRLLPRFESCVEVANVIKSCDCFVSLSKAEGWNLGCLESLACSKHIIATRNTAQTDFLNDANCLLVETPELEDAWDGRWFLGKDFPGEKGQWYKIGKPQLEQFSNHLKTIHKLKQNGELGLNNVDMYNFTWQACASKLVSVLEGI